MEEARWTTDDVTPDARFAYWREAICSVYVQLDAEPMAGNETFGGHVQMEGWGHLRLSQVASDAQVVRRSTTEQGGDCLLSLQLRGRGKVVQRGSEAYLEPGDMALYDASEPYELHFGGPFRQIVMQVPRHALSDRGVDIEGVVARQSVGKDPLTRVSASIITSMVGNLAAVPAGARGRLASSATDCVATMLASMVGSTGTALARDGAFRAQVMTFVQQRLTSTDLSVAFVARRFGCSTRRLQQAFEGTDATLSDRIRRARIARATRSLLDNPAHSVARVASDHGFYDGAHFARVFKAEQGVSPTAYRARNAG